MFSRRIRWALEENELWRELARVRASGKRYWDLTESNPTRVGLAYPETEILQSLARAEALSYEPSPSGLRAARKAVSEYYAGHGASITPDDIVLTASTSEAYSMLFKLLCDPGARVLVPRPSYPLFDFLAALDAVEPISYPLAFDGSWYIDFDALARHVNDSRAIIAVHPNNPTGSYVSTDDGERLVALSAREETALIVDEVFLDYGMGNSTVKSFVNESRGLVCVLSGLSKLAGLPQVKLAWIALAGDEALRARARERLDHIADTYLSVGTPVQHAASTLLELAPAIRAQIRERTRTNLSTLEHAVEDCPPVSVLPLDGGWYATLRLPAITSSEEWALALLRRGSVYLHPGSFFGFAREACVIVSLIVREDDFEQAIRAVIRVVRDRVDSSGA